MFYGEDHPSGAVTFSRGQSLPTGNPQELRPRLHISCWSFHWQNPTAETGKGRRLTESTPDVTGNNGKGKSENGSGAWYVITSKLQARSQLNTFHRQFPDQSKYSGSQRKNEHVKEMAGSFWFTLHKTFAVWDQILIPGKSLGGFL